MLAAIGVMLLVNLAIYTDVVKSSDAIDLREAPTVAGQPGATTPGDPRADEIAEANDDPSLPGQFVPSQGRSHTQAWPLAQRVEYCLPETVRDDCYASMPPSSGLHLPVQRGVALADGSVVTLPPDPGIYNWDMPREAIPHLQEHAGVFIGFNCATDECRGVVLETGRIAQQELSLGARVVMAEFSDLPPDTIGMAAWTRVDMFPAAEFSDERVRGFIKAHSCRFDPEGFCRDVPVN